MLPLLLCVAAVSQGPYEKNVTRATIEQWMSELSNWGRWGKDDQSGALNLITPAKRKSAVALVRDGVSVSLSRDIATEKAVDNSSPFEHRMTWTGKSTPGQFSLDYYGVSYHGYAHTHMDALCHMFYQGKMYNGFLQQEVTDRGANKLSVLNARNGIISRGVLLDIPRLKGSAYLEPSVVIYPEDLEAWEKKAGVRISSGDIVLLRTGRWARRAAKGPWDVAQNSAGFHASCVKWLRQRDPAIVGSDAAADVMPSRVEGVTQPVHQLLLVAMGTPILDNCDLERLSEEANKRQRWEFLLTASPLAVVGGTGSPMNPIATF
jgi:kynurenine formamidase